MRKLIDVDAPCAIFIGYYFSDAIATLIVDETINNELKEEKKNTILSLNSRINFYLSEGLPSYLINTIYKKRLDFIFNAKTVSEMHEIMDMKSNYPVYNYGSWEFRSKYHLDEEELILWSKVSPGLKMTSHASERFFSLGEKYLKGFNLNK